MKIKIRIATILCLTLILVGCSRNDNVNIHAEIAPIKDNRDAIVTIVSDDGDYETGIILNKLAKKYNMKVTVAGIVEWIKPHLNEWKEIESEGNVELISHSYSHLKMDEESNISEKELYHQIVDSKSFFEANFQTDQIAFVPPENVMCELGNKIIVENGIYAVRKGQRGENGLQLLRYDIPGQWYSLTVHGIGDVKSTKERNAWIDNAIVNNTWLIEMWHNVSSNTIAGYQTISSADAISHMEYINQLHSEKKIWAASFVDATKYLYEKKNSTVEAVQEGTSLKIRLKFDNKDNLPKEVFDFPLTVKIPVPIDWLDKDIVTDNGGAVVIEEEKKVQYILIDIVPGSDDIILNAK